VPAPVRGKVVTQSSSCLNQTAKASQIITGYTNTLNNSNTPPNWIVTPVPELAIRQADGSAQPPTNTLSFDDEGHLNPGGDWDAYWRLNGNLNPQNIAGTDRSTTHFDATFGAHAVLWGNDVDIIDISTDVDTATAQTVPVPIGPSSTGSVHLFLFGTEFPTGGFHTDLRGFNVNESLSQELELPPVGIWVFTITLGASADVGVTATGGVSNNGLDIVFTPAATLGAHLKGSIDVVIASGGVDAKVNLLSEKIPLSAKAQWSFSFDPAVCAASLTSSLNGQEQFSSLGGEIDLVATFGICPLCKNVSDTIFKWDPVASYTADLFNTPESTQNFALPASLCTKPLNAVINTPLPNQTFPAGVPVGLSALVTSANDLAAVPCTNYVWTLTPANPIDTVSPLSGSLCNPNVTFSPPVAGPTSSWTISLSATDSYTNQFETIVEAGSATPVAISISPLGQGDYVTQLTDQNGVVYTPNPAACGIDFCLNGNPPQTYTIQGLVNGVKGLPTTTFTVTDSNGNITVLSTTNPNSATPSAVWTPPLTFGLNSGTYTITMQTMVGGGVFASTTSTVFFSVLQ